MKKLIALSFTLALILSCTSCADAKKSSSGDAPAAVTVSQTMYKEESLKKPDDLATITYNCGYGENAGIIYSSEDGMYKIARYSENGEVTATYELFPTSDAIETFFTATADGSAYAMLISSEEDVADYDGYEDFYENAKMDYTMRSYSPTGELIVELSLVDFDKYFTFGQSFINGILPYNGEFIIAANNAVYRIDANGNVTEAAENDSAVLFAEDSEGRLIYSDFNGWCYIDADDLSRKPETAEYGKWLSRTGEIMTGTGDFKAYFALNEGVFGLTQGDELVKLLDYTDSSIDPSDVRGITPVAEGKFLMVSRSMSSGESVSMLTVRPDDYVENKQTVVVGRCWDIDDACRSWAVKYNKQSDLYNVEWKKYDLENDELKEAILSDEAPDVFSYNDYSTMCRYINFGAFTNMYDLMDEYGGFSKDDILPNIIEAFEYRDGLYAIAPRFHPSYMIANSDVINRDKSYWTYDEFYEIAEALPEDMYLGDQMCFIEGSKSLFEYLCSNNLGAWVDNNSYTCSFDSPEFVHLLEFCRDAKVMPPRDWEEFYSSTTEEEQRIDRRENELMAKNKKALLLNYPSGDLFDGLMERVIQVDLFENDGYTFVTPPSDDNHGMIEIWNTDYYSVLGCGDCTEGGWDFVNYMMSYDFQMNDLQMEYSLTTRKDTYEEKKKRFLKKFSKIRVLQSGILVTEESFDSYIYDEPYVEYSITEDDITYIDDFILHCNKLKDQDPAVSKILVEEFDKFINGEQTAEQCAEKVQDRASIYLSEIS